MEDQEAIKWLKQIKNKYIRGGDDFFDARRREAIDKAIHVLEWHDKIITEVEMALLFGRNEDDKQ